MAQIRDSLIILPTFLLLWVPGILGPDHRVLFHIDPLQVNSDIRNEVVLTCALQRPTESWANRSVLIHIESRMGHKYATVSRESFLTHSDNVEAKGVIGRPDTSHLTIKVKNVKETELFKCFFILKDELDEPTVNVSTAQISVTSWYLSNHAFQSAIYSIHQELTAMKKEFVSHENQLDEEFDNFTARLNQVQSDYELNVYGLNSQLAQEASRLNELNYVENTPVMFTVEQQYSDRFITDGSPLIYTKVLANDGNGYNYKTGIFTSPVAGYYLFTFSVFVSSMAYVYVDLKSKDIVLKTMVAGRTLHWRQYSDATCIVKLRATQEVHLSVRRKGGKLSSRSFRDKEYPNQFSGYLLKALLHDGDPKRQSTSFEANFL